ncbi:hypothetical protein [Flexithrix dorotheae]|nr:hypothetical protein [Flexithrix dorotheae]
MYKRIFELAKEGDLEGVKKIAREQLRNNSERVKKCYRKKREANKEN